MSEEGFSYIPNNVLDALIKTPLNSNELRFFWFVMYQNTIDISGIEYLSDGYIAQKTDMSMNELVAAKHSLISKKMILIKDKHLLFNQHTDEWIEVGGDNG